MKKLLKYITLAVICVGSIVACKKEELETDQYLNRGVTFSAMAPNPVMRGGQLRIVGSDLDKVTEVRFAGDVSVKDIEVVTTGKHSEIRVMVPLEGPEVGPVSIVTKDGKSFKSFSDLTFTEPIEIDSFTPETVLSGDLITFRGEYLNDVREVIFSGDESAVVTEFDRQSRHELRVAVPFNAISGPVILSDVNELEDENTIPNHIYTKTDLIVGDPTVDKADKAVYKSGDLITVTGKHLDMISSVELPLAGSVEFVTAQDGRWIKFNLPPKASDGNIILTSFAGVTFDAGEIETVNVAELTVMSMAPDQRFKAHYDVEITGTDLDLVTSVAFEGAEADWYLSGGKIITTVPVAAKDGPVTVSLESGKKAYSEDIVVVKPVATEIDATEGCAGVSVITVSGNDLDLVTAVTIGSKDKGYIDCEYEFVPAENGTTSVAVKLPNQAYTGPITLTAASGYDTVTETITVTYDMVVSISFDKPSYGLGSYISITGKNLLQIDQVYIKGKRVTSFAKRADDAMGLGIPDGIGPGVYRLQLLLMDGTELTWPVPFEITAPFTETFIWEGYEDLGSWSNQPYLGADGAFGEAGLAIGDIVRIYFKPTADWWQFQIFGGHWDGMTFPEFGDTNTVSKDNTEPDAQFASFEVTEANFATLTTAGGWGGALLTQGEGVAITGLSFIHFGAAEQRDVIWEGSSTVTWAGGAVTALSWGGYDWSTVQAGTKLSVAYTIDDPEGCIRFGNGSWASLPSLAGLAPDGNLPLAGNGYTFELTESDINTLVNEGGLVICGTGFTITEIALVTTTSAGPVENLIWEGSEFINWTGMQALAWGGYDWSTVSPGTVLVAHFELDPNAEYWQIRFGNGSWAALPSTAGLAADGNIPLEPGMTSWEFELAEADINALVNEGGLVMTGANYTITAIGLK